MRDWSVLNSKMITWSSEISDPLIKKNYLEWCLDNITSTKVWDFVHNANAKEYYKFKQDFFDTWGRSIPSLKQEYRDKAIDKILN